MHDIEFLIALLAAVALLVRLAGVLRVPYPILLVLGGLVLGLTPGVPEIHLDPEIVFVIFLPPLLYAAAFISSPRELRENVGPISRLAIGLVLVTIAVVAVVAHLAIDGLPWAAAFVLGAILAPTDPVAATAVFRRIGAPNRVVTITEGESLVNDGSALVVYKVATAAVVTGAFSAVDAGVDFVVVGAGGVLVGLVIAVMVGQIRRRLDDPPVEIAISLFTPYAAYILAEQIHVSGVLAVVAAGIYLSWRSAGLFRPGTRLQAYSFWEVLEFLLNGILFLLVGLQVPTILREAEEYSPGTLLALAVLMTAVVIGVRLLWLFTVPYILRRGQDAPLLPRAHRLVLGWGGMRGAVSLAAALALPLETAAGQPFPRRDLFLFLTFAVILATLVLQGLSLPTLVRRLGLSDPVGATKEEAEARVKAVHAALGRMEELAAEDGVPEETVERVRGLYDYRLNRYSAPLGEDDDDGDDAEHTAAFLRLRHELIETERETVERLHDEGEIAGTVMRRIERDLDLEEERLTG